MTLEEEMYEALIPYCVELGWIEFDEDTKKNGIITGDSKLVNWKVVDSEQESAIDYLSTCFPTADESIIRKVIANNLIHIDYEV